jgi:hypothetical protein
MDLCTAALRHASDSGKFVSSYGPGFADMTCHLSTLAGLGLDGVTRDAHRNVRTAFVGSPVRNCKALARSEFGLVFLFYSVNFRPSQAAVTAGPVISLEDRRTIAAARGVFLTRTTPRNRWSAWNRRNRRWMRWMRGSGVPVRPIGMEGVERHRRPREGGDGGNCRGRDESSVLRYGQEMEVVIWIDGSGG